MCTLTLIPKGNRFVLTSNRDEKVGRETLPIDFYEINQQQMLFPKDEVSGGTWIATKEQQMICLLNGGFKNHEKKYFYRHSRGLVVTEILAKENLKKSLETYNCEDLEPFTLVAIDWRNDLSFYQLVWDGTKKHFKQLDSNKCHIWSSSTLYDDEMKKKRQDWFNDFKLNNEITKETMLRFHKTGGIGNEFYDLVIKRGDLQTRSITQVHFNNNLPVMRYEDLLVNEVFVKQFEKIKI